jgi:hypothetical protein
MMAPAQRSVKKLLIAIFAGLAVLAVGSVAIVFQRPSCAGLRDCYLFLHRIQNGQTDADQYREVLLDQFAASSDKIAFSVLMPDKHSVGLLIADRHTGFSRTLSEPGGYFGQPYFSPDGRRFLLVRVRQSRPYRDLLSCQVTTWRCEVVVRTHDSIMFPVGIDAGTILYSSSPMRTAPDGRKLYNHYDLYVVTRGSKPKRLTEFGLHEIGWLGLGGGEVVFGADGYNPTVLPKWKLVRTEIYAAKFDSKRLEVVAGTLPLAPIFQMDTLSIRPAISSDGKRVAFLKVEPIHGKYQYNMTVAASDGAILRSVKVEGRALSHGVFVDGTLLFNELFKDHYRVRMLNLARGTVDDVLTLNHTAEALGKLDAIALQVDDSERSAQPASPALPN